MGSVAPPGGAPATGTDPTSGDDTKRRHGALLLIAVAFVLVILGSVGVLYEGNLVWLNRLEHPFLFGCVAAATFGIGVWRLNSPHWLSVLVVAATVMVGGAWFWFGLLLGAVFGFSILPVATADAPGDHEYQAVVHKGQSMLGDTLYEVSVRQTRGLLSREWPAGCISQEGGWSLDQVRWENPSRLRVTVGWEGYGITVAVDPRTGKPKPPAQGGC